MKDKAKMIMEAAKKKDNKERYTFTLSPTVKKALALWCDAEEAKESAVIEALLKATIPEKYFKD
jgi:hypothetical protein